jgi:predicted RND superfamily exporter protein
MLSNGLEEKFSQVVAEFLVKYRSVLFAVTVLVLAGLVFGAKDLTLDTDGRVFMGDENPDKIAMSQFEDEYVKDDNLALLIKAPLGEDIFSPRMVKITAELTEALWLLPHVRLVNSITNLPAITGTVDGLDVRDLVETPSTASLQDLATARAYAVSKQTVVNTMIDKAATVTAVTVLFRLPGVDQAVEIPQIMFEFADIIAPYEAAHPDVGFMATGSVPVGLAFSAASQSDGTTLVPLMFLCLVATVMLLLRMYSSFVPLMVVSFSCALAAVGALGWSGVPMNSATAAGPLMIIALAIASTVHVLSSTRQTMLVSENRVTWVETALSEHGFAICIACLTTALGFLSLNFSISPAFQQLGNMVAFGMVAICVLTFTMLPAIICWLPVRRSQSTADIERQIMRLAEFVIARRKALLLGFPVVFIVALFGLTKLTFEDDFLRYFDKRFDVRQATDAYENAIGGLNALEYPIETGIESGINSIEFLVHLDAFVIFLRAQPEVSNVRSISDTIKQLNQSMNGDDPAFYKIPENDALASQYLFLYELSLGYGSDLTDQINVDRSGTRITVFVPNTSTSKLRILDAKIQDWFEENAPELKTAVTGQTFVYTMISTRDVPSMFKGTLLALVGISFLLLPLLQNLKLGVLTLIPNLLPALVAFGLWGHFIGDITLAVSVVVAMTLGIVVDDTVHFMLSYSKHRRRGQSAEQAVRSAFGSVGMAITVTTIALVIGFGILSLSGFAVNRDMGRLSAITVFLALVIDLMFLPPLLMWLDTDKNKTQGHVQ